MNEYRYETLEGSGVIRRSGPGIEGREWCGRMISAELAQQVCDALNSGPTNIQDELDSALQSLDALHDRLRLLQHEGVSEETQRQARTVVNNHVASVEAGGVAFQAARIAGNVIRHK
jgi:hypothetical protein